MPTTLPRTARTSQRSKLLFDSAGNECAMLIESMDWSKSTLGPIASWPMSLHIILSAVLNSRFPMFVFWGPDHYCFYNNAARFRSVGRHPYVLGKKGADAWEEKWMIYKPMIDRVIEFGETNWVEDQAIPIVADGKNTDSYATYSYSPLYDESGRRVGVLVTGFDSTEKVKNLKKLEDSEQTLRNLILQAPVGIVMLRGSDFVIEDANDHYFLLTNRNESIIGKRVIELAPEIEHGLLKELQQVRETGIPYHGREYPMTVSRGGSEETIYLNFTYEPLRESNGTIDRILVIISDVTDQVIRKQRALEGEKELRQMADSMPHLVWVSNEEGTITFISDRIAEYSGATRRADGTWRWEGMVHPDDRTVTAKAWLNALTAGAPYEVTHRLEMNDGVYKWHISRATPFRNQRGRITKWFGTATNIDDQKRFANELELRVAERTKELQASNHELAQFAYIASHDLQEPLRKIITFIELLQRGLKDADVRSTEYLKKIEQSAIRMSVLIRDILNLSQLSKPNDIFTQVNLNESLRSILGDLEVTIQEKNAIVSADHLPTIRAISPQMNQLFFNLISNSLKFVQAGQQPVIAITSRILEEREIALLYPSLDSQHKYCVIQFKDNGIGFNEKYAEQIFTIFQRLNTRQQYAGTGIGLALCKKIVSNHQGAIRASSREGSGATFEVVLPLSPK